MRRDITEAKAEVSNSSGECLTPEKWLCYDGMATELEVLNFLEALVVMMKPEIIVETGTWYGYGTIHLAHGVKENGFGLVHTAEVDGSILAIAEANINKFVPSSVVLHHGTGMALISTFERIGFAFLDSGDGSTRSEEMKAVLPRLSDNGVIAIHDTGSTHAGWRDQVFATANELGLQVFQFATPRGITLLQRKKA